MSRALFLSMTQADVVAKCHAADVGISDIEALPDSGVRLVCMSVHGAERMRAKLKAHLMTGEPKRQKIRPTRPLW